MPKGTKILSVTPSGASAWVHSVCIEACLPDGARKLYFLKVSFISPPVSTHRVIASKAPNLVSYGSPVCSVGNHCHCQLSYLMGYPYCTLSNMTAPFRSTIGYPREHLRESISQMMTALWHQVSSNLDRMEVMLSHVTRLCSTRSDFSRSIRLANSAEGFSRERSNPRRSFTNTYPNTCLSLTLGESINLSRIIGSTCAISTIW